MSFMESPLDGQIDFADPETRFSSDNVLSIRPVCARSRRLNLEFPNLITQI